MVVLRRVAGLCPLLLLTACQHQDAPSGETRSSASPEVTQLGARTPSSTPPSDIPGCLWPLPASPPAAASPATHCPPDPAPAAPLTRLQVVFADAEGQPSVEVELARTDAERSRGLMYRTTLPPESGMLFAWTTEEHRAFWMRNTCIPLDMLFIDRQKRIVGIVEQVPVLNERSRSVPCPASFVLEVNAGYCRAHGIFPGQRIDVQLPPEP